MLTKSGFVSNLYEAAMNGLTLMEFIRSTHRKYGTSLESLQTRYYSFLKELREEINIAPKSQRSKELSRYLDVLRLKPARAGRKKTDILQVLRTSIR